jgi:hypothetical protein
MIVIRSSLSLGNDTNPQAQKVSATCHQVSHISINLHTNESAHQHINTTTQQHSTTEPQQHSKTAPQQHIKKQRSHTDLQSLCLNTIINNQSNEGCVRPRRGFLMSFSHWVDIDVLVRDPVAEWFWNRPQ